MVMNKLGVHHHAQVIPSAGGFRTQSFIGRWLNELSNYFEITYFAESAENEHGKFDVFLEQRVKVVIIDSNRNNSRYRRNKLIRQKLLLFQQEFDAFLIRGITPKQYIFYSAFKHVPFFYLLVGSLEDAGRSAISSGLQSSVFFAYRNWQIKRISKESFFFANSPKTCSELTKRFGKTAGYISTNTIRNEEISGRTNLKNVARNIIYCGRIVHDKGILELLTAVQNLNQRGFDFKLTIIGEVVNSFGSNEVWRKALANCFWLEYKGFVPYGRELLDFYKKSDVFVLPSYHEGFPHAIWEAAATNTPVITTNVGGIGGVLNEGCAYFIEPRSVLSIENALIAVRDNISLRISMVENLKKMLRNLTLEEGVKKSVSELSKLL